jgi:tRNA modification GTPase
VEADAGADGREGTALTDTIFALSSGAPPAAVALIRISGPRADAALAALAGRLPEPRVATFRRLRAGNEVLDNTVILRFPGPNSATGEDISELHLHGGRAVVARALAVLAAMPGLRPAEPGEFTRRAFENGRIDLAEAEGLADLLEAETESQRRAALALAGGALSRQIEAWQERLLALAAQIEAALDFSDEDDVALLPGDFGAQVGALRDELAAALARPRAERLKDGIKVAIAGPPNAGKSSLLNALVGRDAAITSAIPGTTRDLVEAPTAIGGVPFLLIDSAGLRDSGDPVEAIGVARAQASVAAADIVLWLGDPREAPERALLVHAKSDLGPARGPVDASVSVMTGDGLDALTRLLIQRSGMLLPVEGDVALHERHWTALREAYEALTEVKAADPLIAAEALRWARNALDRVTGKAGVEDMLDTLFGRFCIGK